MLDIWKSCIFLKHEGLSALLAFSRDFFPSAGTKGVRVLSSPQGGSNGSKLSGGDACTVLLRGKVWSSTLFRLDFISQSLRFMAKDIDETHTIASSTFKASRAIHDRLIFFFLAFPLISHMHVMDLDYSYPYPLVPCPRTISSHKSPSYFHVLPKSDSNAFN